MHYSWFICELLVSMRIIITSNSIIDILMTKLGDRFSYHIMNGMGLVVEVCRSEVQIAKHRTVWLHSKQLIFNHQMIEIEWLIWFSLKMPNWKPCCNFIIASNLNYKRFCAHISKEKTCTPKNLQLQTAFYTRIHNYMDMIRPKWIGT